MFRPAIIRSFNSNCFLLNNKILLHPKVSFNLSEIAPTSIHRGNRSYSDSTSSTPIFQGLYSSLSESAPVLQSQQLLELIHDHTSLPWWATIVAGTVSLRFIVTFPLSAYQHYIFGKVENLKPEMEGLMKQLKTETAVAIKKFKWTEKQTKLAFNRSAKTQWNKLIVRENCHPFKASILLWAQIPLWVCMSVGLRNMTMMMPAQTTEAQLLYYSLSNEGFGWIPNLTDVDHSFILPVVMVLTNLAIIQLQVATRVTPTSRFGRGVTNTLRVLCLVMLPIASYAPAGLALYWTTSSLYGLSQNIVMLSPKVRRSLKIPATPQEIQHPYKHIADQIKNKFT